MVSPVKYVIFNGKTRERPPEILFPKEPVVVCFRKKIGLCLEHEPNTQGLCPG